MKCMSVEFVLSKVVASDITKMCSLDYRMKSDINAVLVTTSLYLCYKACS